MEFSLGMRLCVIAYLEREPGKDKFQDSTTVLLGSKLSFKY